MDFDELNDFADWETKRLAISLRKSSDEMKSADGVRLSRAIKEYLKVVKKNETNKIVLEKKYAEVIILATLLAKRLNLDIAQSVDKMVDSIRARRYN